MLWRRLWPFENTAAAAGIAERSARKGATRATTVAAHEVLGHISLLAPRPDRPAQWAEPD